MKFKAAGRPDILKAFEEVDSHLRKKSKKLKVRILGGASILLLGVRNRVTEDIDIAGTSDAVEFQKICARQNVKVDIITIASTVDLEHCEAVGVFAGEFLTVDSVTPKDLVKLKLERFYKQDPEDIYAIIRHENMSFDEFAALALDAVKDYIGNERELILSATMVVEQMWPARAEEFALMKGLGR